MNGVLLLGVTVRIVDEACAEAGPLPVVVIAALPLGAAGTNPTVGAEPGMVLVTKLTCGTVMVWVE